jgi:predicted nucleic acid-binding Zn ribbon protein
MNNYGAIRSNKPMAMRRSEILSKKQKERKKRKKTILNLAFAMALIAVSSVVIFFSGRI